MPDRDRITANEGLASAVALVTLVGLMALLRAPSMLCGVTALVVTHASIDVSRAVAHGDGRGAFETATRPLVLTLSLLLLASIDQLMVEVTRVPRGVCGNATLWVPFAIAYALWSGRGLQRRLLGGVARLRGRSLARPLRALALVCAVALAGTGVHGALRARRFPSLGGWVGAQPVVGVLPPIDVAHARSAPADDALRVGEVCVERHCAADTRETYRCFARVVRTCEASVAGACTHDRHDEVPPTSSLRIRRNRRLDAWVIEPEGGESLAFEGPAFERVAYSGPLLTPELSAPPGWIIGALTGSALAIALVLVSLARRPFDARGWRSARHQGDGRIDLDDISRFAPCAAAMAPGDVIVRVCAPDAVPFRGADSPIVEEVVAGSLDGAKERAELLSAAPAMLAISTAASLGAPLALAAMLGLT